MDEPRWVFLSSLGRVPLLQEAFALAARAGAKRVEANLRRFPPEQARAIRKAAMKAAHTTTYDYESAIYLLCAVALERAPAEFSATTFGMLPEQQPAPNYDKWWVGLERQHKATQLARGRKNHGRKL